MPNKGFATPSQPRRYVAIELNIEDIEADEVLDLIQLHHLAIKPVTSKRDKARIQLFSDAICGGFSVISPTEFLAELYTTTINESALELGANVGRIYHNSCLGDVRFRKNSICHIFEPGQGSELLPKEATQLLRRYVEVAAIVDGDNVTLRNRLGT